MLVYLPIEETHLVPGAQLGWITHDERLVMVDYVIARIGNELIMCQTTLAETVPIISGARFMIKADIDDYAYQNTAWVLLTGAGEIDD